MKNILFTLFLLTVFLHASAQTTFHHRYTPAGSYGVEASDIAITADSGFMVTANNYLIKTDKNGYAQWTKKYVDSTSTYLSFVQIIRDTSGYFILGRGDGISLIHADTAGVINWGKRFVISSLNPTSFIKCFDGSFMILANDTGSMIVIKVNSTGNIIWSKRFTGPYGNKIYGGDIIELPSHDVVFCGTVKDFMTFVDVDFSELAVITKIDSASTVRWSKQFLINASMPLPFFIIPTHILLTSQNKFLLSFEQSMKGLIEGGDSRIAQLDSNGSLLSVHHACIGYFFGEPVSTQADVIAVSEYPVGTINFCDKGSGAPTSNPLNHNGYYPKFIKTDLNLLTQSQTLFQAPGHPAEVPSNWFTFNNAHELPDHRFAFAGGLEMSNYGAVVVVTDAQGTETCTNAPAFMDFPGDISFLVRSTSLAKASVSLQTVDGKFAVTSISSQDCTCDSFPTANFSFTASGDTVTFTNLSTNAISYRWWYGDNKNDSMINPVHIYNAPDTFTVVLEAFNRCGSDAFITTTIVTKVADNYFENIKVSIDPNPVTNYLSLKFSKEISNGIVRLFDFSGAEVVAEMPLKNTMQSQIDMHALAKGIYFMQITTDKGSFTQKIIKE